MSKISYWRFQILWWLAYAAIGLAINIAFGERPGPVVAVHIIWVAVSIGLTDAFRGIIDRRRRPDRSVWRMWPVLLGGTVVISALQTAMIVGLTSTILPTSNSAPSGGWAVTAIASLGYGMLLGTGIWTGLYARFAERQQQQEHELKLRAAASEAELRALEAQINPHFLFNCLNSIRALIAENPAKAQEMITRLANIFRYNLHREPSHTVPLSSEVEAVSDYLALESVRFEDRLRVQFAIDQEASRSAVPSMLLQALVENALKHGIAPRPSGGDLVIRARHSPEATTIEVENSGQLGAESPEAGVGLANTRERLRILYGERASLQLRNRDDGHVVATVLIPAQA